MRAANGDRGHAVCHHLRHTPFVSLVAAEERRAVTADAAARLRFLGTRIAGPSAWSRRSALILPRLRRRPSP